MDPLEKARQDGYAAANRLLADAQNNNDLDELVRDIRTAAGTDSKFNWHIIEAIAALAVKGYSENNGD